VTAVDGAPHPDQAALFRLAAEGLQSDPPTLPPSLFYDEQGSELFDRICELDEYYLTRAEISILERCGGEIARAAGAGARIVELGSGSGLKTAILLDALDEPSEYVAIDISPSALEALERYLVDRFPALPIRTIAADYNAPLGRALGDAGGRTVAFFPGSTVGNMEPAAAQRFLARMAALCGDGGGLLIGVDLEKAPEVIERAYNDAAGVTAEFNLNILRRLNRELGTDFDLDGFHHQAVYESQQGRVEMRLVSDRDQVVTVPAPGAASRDQPTLTVRLTRGDHIVTEHSYKYDAEAFAGLAAEAGWKRCATWLDEREYFAVFYFERRPAPASPEQE
jgi:dimethylhistidine N-methyltransferase